MTKAGEPKAKALAKVELSQIKEYLPANLAPLRAEAAKDGYGFLERLFGDWERGACRFDRPGERLLGATVDGVVAGIGGVTIDPEEDGSMRMRRFYVSSRFRGVGIARLLAETLLRDLGERNKDVLVNAGTELAPYFWESIGFIPVTAERHTHVWRQPK